MLELTGDPRINHLDMLQAKQIAETLHRHYPDHLWGVTCEGEQGIATVRNLRLSGIWGFVIKLRELNADPDMKCVIRAGGELLERYRLSRSRFRADEWMGLPTDFSGHFTPDK